MHGVTEVRGGMSEFGMLPRRLKIGVQLSRLSHSAKSFRDFNLFIELPVMLSIAAIAEMVIVNVKRRSARSKKG